MNGTAAYTDLLNLLAEQVPGVKVVYDTPAFVELSRAVYASLGAGITRAHARVRDSLPDRWRVQLRGLAERA